MHKEPIRGFSYLVTKGSLYIVLDHIMDKEINDWMILHGFAKLKEKSSVLIFNKICSFLEFSWQFCTFQGMRSVKYFFPIWIEKLWHVNSHYICISPKQGEKCIQSVKQKYKWSIFGHLILRICSLS